MLLPMFLLELKVCCFSFAGLLLVTPHAAVASATAPAGLLLVHWCAALLVPWCCFFASGGARG